MMKKRLISCLLAVFLLMGIVIPASAANGSAAFQYMVDCAKQGNYDAAAKTFSNNYNMGSAGSLRISYREQSKKIELRVKRSSAPYYEILLEIGSNLSTPYQVTMKLYFDFDPSVVNGNPKTRSLNPATYTENTNLFSEYSGESANLLIDLTASLVEKLNLLLDTGNYSIKDLGFTKFTRHRYHVAGYAVITREPTCAKQGELTIYCKLCGQAVATESIPKTSNHSWNNGTVIVAPSCTNNGWTQYKCTVCNVARNEHPPALGHAWSYTETLTPGEDDVHGTARYTCTRCQQTKDGLLCAAEVFTDMPADGNWAHKPIDWAYFSGVTSGKTATSFEPKTKITRAEAMTFLWTAAGKPTSTLSESPFTDVTAGKYYYKPVLWAVEHHITGGKTETSFAPKAQCSRAEIMTFLWNAVGKPAHSLAESPFTDVTPGKYYYNAVLWAYEKGVTGGTTDTTFSPKTVCTRAQVVTFLYKVKDLLAAEPVEVPEGNDPACQ